MTTRRFPRTMNDAFKGADCANCFEGSERHPGDKWVTITLAVAIIVIILSIAFVEAAS